MCSSTTFCFAPEEFAEVLDPNGCAFQCLHKDEEYPGSDLDVNSTDDSPLTRAEADVEGSACVCSNGEPARDDFSLFAGVRIDLSDRDPYTLRPLPIEKSRHLTFCSIPVKTPVEICCLVSAWSKHRCI